MKPDIVVRSGSGKKRNVRILVSEENTDRKDVKGHSNSVLKNPKIRIKMIKKGVASTCRWIRESTSKIETFIEKTETVEEAKELLDLMRRTAKEIDAVLIFNCINSQYGLDITVDKSKENSDGVWDGSSKNTKLAKEAITSFMVGTEEEEQKVEFDMGDEGEWKINPPTQHWTPHKVGNFSLCVDSDRRLYASRFTRTESVIERILPKVNFNQVFRPGYSMLDDAGLTNLMERIERKPRTNSVVRSQLKLIAHLKKGDPNLVDILIHMKIANLSELLSHLEIPYHMSLARLAIVKCILPFEEPEAVKILFRTIKSKISTIATHSVIVCSTLQFLLYSAKLLEPPSCHEIALAIINGYIQPQDFAPLLL